MVSMKAEAALWGNLGEEPAGSQRYQLAAVAADVLAASEDVTLHRVFHFFLGGACI